MPIPDKNLSNISIGALIKYPVDSGKTEYHYGYVVGITQTVSGKDILSIEPIKHTINVDSDDAEIITMLNAMSGETGTAFHNDEDEINKALA
jgi:hypothetical protein